jgi:TonB family protein
MTELGDDRRALAVSAFLACAMELGAMIWASSDRQCLTQVEKDKLIDSSRFVEAEVLRLPEKAHLVEQKKVAIPAPKETAVSTKVGVGRRAKPGENSVPDHNQTQTAPPLAASHGPIVVSSPLPAIPPYLKDKDLKASVVIDFAVFPDGTTQPRLAGSSGNEELDALAIAAAHRWLFRPAEKDHQAIYAKVRLRINFEVN